MGLASIVKPRANRVIGIDASTNSIAFAIIEDGKLVASVVQEGLIRVKKPKP